MKRDWTLARLTSGNRESARALFELLAEIFEEDYFPPRDAYIDYLLASPNFWALAASVDGVVVGGLTAHTMTMTRSESAEIFIYDLGVREDLQGQGIGRGLMAFLGEQAAQEGLTEVIVPSDAEDLAALDFYRALGGVETRASVFVFSHPPLQSSDVEG